MTSRERRYHNSKKWGRQSEPLFRQKFKDSLIINENGFEISFEIKMKPAKQQKHLTLFTFQP